MQMLVEGLAMGAFANGYKYNRDPLARKLFQLVMTDEAFHHKFGKIWADRTVPLMSERERNIVEDWAAHCCQALMFSNTGPMQQAAVYEDFGLDPERVIDAFKDMVAKRDPNRKMRGATNTFRVLIKTLLSGHIITERTRGGFYAHVRRHGRAGGRGRRHARRGDRRGRHPLPPGDQLGDRTAATAATARAGRGGVAGARPADVLRRSPAGQRRDRGGSAPARRALHRLAASDPPRLRPGEWTFAGRGRPHAQRRPYLPSRTFADTIGRSGPGCAGFAYSAIPGGTSVCGIISVQARRRSYLHDMRLTGDFQTAIDFTERIRITSRTIPVPETTVRIAYRYAGPCASSR